MNDQSLGHVVSSDIVNQEYEDQVQLEAAGQQDVYEEEDPELGQKREIINQNAERLQLINLKLRNRIKELNAVVERALERQTSKVVAK